MSKTSPETTSYQAKSSSFTTIQFSSQISFLQPNIKQVFMILQWVTYCRIPAQSHTETSAIWKGEIATPFPTGACERRTAYNRKGEAGVTVCRDTLIPSLWGLAICLRFPGMAGVGAAAPADLQLQLAGLHKWLPLKGHVPLHICTVLSWDSLEVPWMYWTCNPDYGRVNPMQ